MKYGIVGNCPTEVLSERTVARIGRTTAATTPATRRGSTGSRGCRAASPNRNGRFEYIVSLEGGCCTHSECRATPDNGGGGGGGRGGGGRRRRFGCVPAPP